MPPPRAIATPVTLLFPKLDDVTSYKESDAEEESVVGSNNLWSELTLLVDICPEGVEFKRTALFFSPLRSTLFNCKTSFPCAATVANTTAIKKALRIWKRDENGVF